MFNPLRPIRPIQCSTTHLTSSPEYLRQFYLSGFSTDNFAYILPTLMVHIFAQINFSSQNNYSYCCSNI